jgi:hypothetical protein
MADLDLHDVLDELDPGPLPIEQITSRAARIRRRRIGAVLGSCAAVAVMAFAVVPHGTSPAASSNPAAPTFGKPGGPAYIGAEMPGRVPASPPVITNGVPSGSNVVATGLVGNARWQIGVTSSQVPGMGCLPAVLLGGSSPDILFPHPSLTATPAGAMSLVSGVPGIDGASFAVFRLPAWVHSLVLDGAARMTLIPVTATACGQRVRLAAIAFDSRTGVTLTANGKRFAVVPRLPTSGDWETLGNGSLPASQLHLLASGHGWRISVLVHGKLFCAQLTGPHTPLGLQPAPVCQTSAGQDMSNAPVAEMQQISGPRVVYGYVFQVSSGSTVAVNPVTGASVVLHAVTIGGLHLAGYAGDSSIGSLSVGNASISFVGVTGQ